MNKSKLNLANVITKNKNLVSSELDGEVVLMSIEQGRYYGMDSILSRIWNLIEKPMTVIDICETLLQEYNVDKEVCQTDVLSALDELLNEKLIQVNK